jgi:cytoskeletal protein CcmA (bactofilin family)
MFFRRKGTIIAEGLTINGNVSAEGLIEVNGKIEGEVRCTFLLVSARAVIKGAIEAERVAVSGHVEGPIRASEVVLKSRAHVVGDIQQQRLIIDSGAYFSGCSTCLSATNERKAPEKLAVRLRRVNELKATREPEDASVA